MKQEIDSAIWTVQTVCKNEQARAYANVAATMLQSGEFNTRAFEIQLLYVLSNLTHWRGDKARETKVILKAFLSKSELAKSTKLNKQTV